MATLLSGVVVRWYVTSKKLRVPAIQSGLLRLVSGDSPANVICLAVPSLIPPPRVPVLIVTALPWRVADAVVPVARAA
ncbi:MAG: hypothetical protein ACKOZU_11035 [Planctomycetaceae bacterium]